MMNYFEAQTKYRFLSLADGGDKPYFAGSEPTPTSDCTERRSMQDPMSTAYFVFNEMSNRYKLNSRFLCGS